MKVGFTKYEVGSIHGTFKIIGQKRHPTKGHLLFEIECIKCGIKGTTATVTARIATHTCGKVDAKTTQFRIPKEHRPKVHKTRQNDISAFNEAREALGLPIIVTKHRNCLSCRKQFESLCGERRCMRCRRFAEEVNQAYEIQGQPLL